MPIRAAKVRKILQTTMPSGGQKLPKGIKKAKKAQYLRKFNCLVPPEEPLKGIRRALKSR